MQTDYTLKLDHQAKRYGGMKYTLQGKEGSISLGEYPTIPLAEARKKRD